MKSRPILNGRGGEGAACANLLGAGRQTPQAPSRRGEPCGCPTKREEAPLEPTRTSLARALASSASNFPISEMDRD
jgi:hypothetical protein